MLFHALGLPPWTEPRKYGEPDLNAIRTDWQKTTSDIKNLYASANLAIVLTDPQKATSQQRSLGKALFQSHFKDSKFYRLVASLLDPHQQTPKEILECMRKHLFQSQSESTLSQSESTLSQSESTLSGGPSSSAKYNTLRTILDSELQATPDTNMEALLWKLKGEYIQYCRAGFQEKISERYLVQRFFENVTIRELPYVANDHANIAKIAEQSTLAEMVREIIRRYTVYQRHFHSSTAHHDTPGVINQVTNQTLSEKTKQVRETDCLYHFTGGIRKRGCTNTNCPRQHRPELKNLFTWKEFLRIRQQLPACFEAPQRSSKTASHGKKKAKRPFKSSDFKSNASKTSNMDKPRSSRFSLKETKLFKALLNLAEQKNNDDTPPKTERIFDTFDSRGTTNYSEQPRGNSDPQSLGL